MWGQACPGQQRQLQRLQSWHSNGLPVRHGDSAGLLDHAAAVVLGIPVGLLCGLLLLLLLLLQVLLPMRQGRTRLRGQARWGEMGVGPVLGMHLGERAPQV